MSGLGHVVPGHAQGLARLLAAASRHAMLRVIHGVIEPLAAREGIHKQHGERIPAEFRHLLGVSGRVADEDDGPHPGPGEHAREFGRRPERVLPRPGRKGDEDDRPEAAFRPAELVDQILREVPLGVRRIIAPEPDLYALGPPANGSEHHEQLRALVDGVQEVAPTSIVVAQIEDRIEVGHRRQAVCDPRSRLPERATMAADKSDGRGTVDCGLQRRGPLGADHALQQHSGSKRDRLRLLYVVMVAAAILLPVQVLPRVRLQHSALGIVLEREPQLQHWRARGRLSNRPNPFPHTGRERRFKQVVTDAVPRPPNRSLRPLVTVVFGDAQDCIGELAHTAHRRPAAVIEARELEHVRLGGL